MHQLHPREHPWGDIRLDHNGEATFLTAERSTDPDCLFVHLKVADCPPDHQLLDKEEQDAGAVLFHITVSIRLPRADTIVLAQYEGGPIVPRDMAAFESAKYMRDEINRAVFTARFNLRALAAVAHHHPVAAQGTT
ncbi:hypothetical protein [Kitasatospora viridis]|uniref:Uncharacterized protein n=1 Tax=Kitasatospora viridis TaxID=281105 RepID=A0A561SA59_9ACTN|nr:hypothetical protein [Kitasatospora viridis]TWF71762.1 hypothetical protein FHX73_18133 [Kitasatospora viridis]